MRPALERRALQAAVAVLGLVPTGAGAAGLLLGLRMVGATGDISAGSHYRYLSGLLLGIGLAFWAMVPRIEAHGSGFRLLTAVVVVGGLSRLLGLAVDGMPDGPMLFGLGMELVVTPALCLWQGRVARRYAAPARSSPESPSR